eukprot:699140-Prorocentrum_minimum.AAC.1
MASLVALPRPDESQWRPLYVPGGVGVAAGADAGEGAGAAEGSSGDPAAQGVEGVGVEVRTGARGEAGNKQIEPE